MTLALPMSSQSTGAATHEKPEGCFLTVPHPELLFSVVVPAKDEADNLPATLAALTTQTDLLGQPLPPRCYEVLLLANNCRDATAHVARQWALAHPHLTLHVQELTLPPAAAHVGTARRLLMDEAARRLRAVGRPLGLLLSTDADTRVAPTWLAATAAEVAAGADAVGGRILTEAGAPAACPVRRCYLRDATYHLLAARLEHQLDPTSADPWPRHHQHFGASLALTAAAYEQVGGLPVVPYLEDEALYQALCRHDLRVRHSPAVRVTTSSRRDGRVAVGLSWQLREWAALSEQLREPLVAGRPELAARWQARRHLRSLWQQSRALPAGLAGAWPSVAAVADELRLSAPLVAEQLGQAPTFGALWQWVVAEQAATSQWAQRWAAVPLSQAIWELRR